jgi:hypothetical protein
MVINARRVITSVTEPDLEPDLYPDLYPDPYVFGSPGSGYVSMRYRSGSVYHQAKIVRKTFIPTVLSLLHDFLSLKNDVNLASISTFFLKK